MSEEITVSIKGGRSLSLPKGASVAEALGPDVSGAIAATIDGCSVDLSRPLDHDCDIAPLPASCEQALEVIRHSTAHLLAQAVKHLHPEAQVTIGPVIKDGFYYDFKYDRGFTPEDLEAISEEMGKLVAADLGVSREETGRMEAVEMFRSMGEEYKVEIIDGLDEDSVSLYRQGDFVDLCRGPHVASTGCLGAFKLTHVAGAYWRGDENNAMLQRIYGTAFATRGELDEHLERIEEARRRDHRKLGKQLGLFSFHKEAPATPFFHPDGALVYNLLIDYIRGLYKDYGYDEVITPQVLDVSLWQRSGHYDNYRDNMYFTEVDGRSFAVKPMNCPGHCLMYSETVRSYRELPMRLADFGRLHRYERSGVVHGLTRVRAFCQDDAHVFCTPEQMSDEIRSVVDMITTALAVFGFEGRKVYLSTKPDKAIGEPEMWEKAEATLKEVLDDEGIDYTVNQGDGAFYGPKIDFCVLDAMGREWQLSTVQLDFSMPERFDLAFIGRDGAEARPVMIHRAILGSLERFIAILLEHTAGALPLWLAPCQVRLVTVTDRHNEYAADVVSRLKREGVRAKADLRNEKLGFKIREAQQSKIPVVAVVGDREMESGSVAPRLRDGSKLDAMEVGSFIDWLHERLESGNGGVP
ncbi:MAG: threonine--tRNA ligase [Deltaproteobacteria bacterium]